MKVLVVASSPKVKGGINSVVVSLLEGFRTRTTDLQFERFSSYINSVPPFLRILYSTATFAKFAWRVLPFDVVHVHSAAHGSFYRKSVYTYLAKLLGKQVIFHIHASGFEQFQKSNRFNARLVKSTLEKADEIIVLSDQMKLLVNGACGNPNVTILPNPVAIPDAAAIAPLRRHRDRVNLLFLGEIGPRKGIYDLIDAIEKLTERERSELTLHVCGNNEIDQLKAYIKDKGLEDSCIVHGWIDGERKKDFLANADIYILPSYAEGLPISILEAMAYSLPIISTNVGGIPEIVREGENGFVLEPGQTDSLARAIRTLVGHPQLRRAYGQRSHEIVTPHDIHQVLDTLTNIYKKALRR
ncbi:glycosyltransferase family 4 protein [Cohnella sp. AR92]|uniref:glycosyltransferase family 4 protein n=1 Tax=Cohnella sp. AR92 TaxID=648716 RepID=UPI000F8F467E|nr:glycosyltransferase family 4 protein [Cohnella sp. AR92]RUS42613.1 glycosyltransferase family 1 protein [Cohnella sp. AR92]